MNSTNTSPNLSRLVGEKAKEVYDFATNAISLVQSFNVAEAKKQGIDDIDFGGIEKVIGPVTPISIEEAKSALVISADMMNLYSFFLNPDTDKADELYGNHMSAYKNFKQLTQSKGSS